MAEMSHLLMKIVSILLIDSKGQSETGVIFDYFDRQLLRIA